MEYTNGHGASVAPAVTIDIPIKGQNDVLSIDCRELPEDARELCDFLANEEAEPKYWVKLAFEYRNINLVDQAISILTTGLTTPAIQHAGQRRFAFFSLLSSLYIEKARHAPTGPHRPADGSDVPNKEHWQRLATQALNDATRINPGNTANTIAKGVLSMMRLETDRTMDEANRAFEQSARSGRTNLFALLGRARVLYTRRKYKESLACYQRVLQARPTLLPDPRIGIGLCFWQLGQREDALYAWERSLELDAGNAPAALLAGIAHVHTAFDHVSEPEVFQKEYTVGLKLVSRVYKEHGYALAGTVLASYYFSKRDIDSLSRVIEKALTSTEVPAIKADAFLWLGRGKHLTDQPADAASFYNLARQAQPDLLCANLGIAQLQLGRAELTDAKLTFESILEKQPKCIEACAALGTLYANEVLDPSFKGDAEVHKSKARALLERAIALTQEHKQRSFSDASLHFAKVMVADQEQPLQTLRLLEQAFDIETETGAAVSAEILNDMAILHQQEGHGPVAEELYAKALEAAQSTDAGAASSDASAITSAVKYNIGRCAEAAGDLVKAKSTYEELLAEHPNYVDATARLAYIAYIGGDAARADELCQQVLAIEPNNIETRALYGWLLNKTKVIKGIHYNEDPERRHFNHTLKHIDNFERYSLTALGNFYLKLARDTRVDNEAGKAERHKHYDMAIKFLERALHYDGHNAYAAQGLGIAFAEHREFNRALGIFQKVRETLRDESIFLNLGHCLAELRQYSRAIECYETCLQTYHNGKDATLYQCLGRVWLAKGRDERSIDALREALRYTKLAQEELPTNAAVTFNVAFVQFQTADILRNLPEIQRTVKDLQDAAAGLQEAIKAFGKLAESKYAPYDRDELRQRAQMGNNTTSRQLERAIQQQTEYERRNADKVEEARQRREADRVAREAKLAEQKAVEDARQEALREARQKMQDEALAWAEKRREEEAEKEERDREEKELKKERAAKRKMRKADRDSDSDGEGGGDSDGEAKRKRRNRRRRDDESDIEGIVDDEEEIERDGAPRKKVKSSKKAAKPKKKRTLRGPANRAGSDDDLDLPDVPENDADDEDGDGAATSTRRKGSSKKYISSEMVDSDLDDDDGLTLPEQVNGKEMPINQLANENMIGNDRERASDDEGDLEAKPSGVPQGPASDGDNAPPTNGPDAQRGASVLLKQKSDSMRIDEEPGIGVDGQAPPTPTAGDDEDDEM